MRKVLGVIMCVWAVAGCGGGNDAPQKCNALVTKTCARVIACANDGTTQAECEAQVKTTLPCAGADAVGDTYAACMSELDQSPCSVLIANDTINPPASCSQVILFNN
jgi:hypothetical protein